MIVCYNRLWKLLIDKGINKTQLCKEAKIIVKLGRNEDIRVEVLMKIYCTLGCTMDDIIEFAEDREGEN